MTQEASRGAADFLALVERSDDVYFHVRLQPERQYVYVSPGSTAMMGYSPDEHYADPDLGLKAVHPDDRALLLDAERLVESPVTLRWRRRDGGVLWTEQRTIAIRDADGQITELLGVARDITAQREADAERERMAAIVASATDAIYSITLDGILTTWNPGAERLYGWTAEQAIGRSIDLVIPPDLRPEVEQQLQALERGEPWQDHHTRRMARDGRIIDVAITSSAMYDSTGAFVGMSVIVRDIGERLVLQRGLQHLAEHDALTGLPNRARFEQELIREVEHGLRHARPSAVLLVDIDHFKFINDSLGHEAGDRVLREAAAALEHAAREGDLVARLGGDEFALLLRDTDRDAATVAADRFLVAVRAQVETASITATAGVATFDGTERVDPDEVLIAADIALYEAKQHGRNRAKAYAGKRGETLAWIDAVRAAISEERFVLAAQAIVDLASGDPVLFELLLRMHADDGELALPARFLPTAERFGMMGDIDRWVVDRAAQIAAGGRPVTVNLSAASIGDPSFGEFAVDRITAAGARPQDLVFEITETAAIGCLPEAARFTRRVTEVGAGVALDDFGTGFGSLLYLKHLAVTHLKIDAEFVRDLQRSATDRRIVTGIVGMASGMGARTVGEGVEDAALLAVLRELGVDLAQGYAIERPAPLT